MYFNLKVIKNDREFWKTVKSLFSDKSEPGNTVKIMENKTSDVTNSKTADIPSYLFSKILTSLKNLQIEHLITYWSAYHKLN